MLGDIVCIEPDSDRPINLLAETIMVDAALQLNELAREAVAFLKQNNVKVHTVEPNFCHAKTILFRAATRPGRFYYKTVESKPTTQIAGAWAISFKATNPSSSSLMKAITSATESPDNTNTQ